MTTIRSRWRFFWSRRSRRRTTLALVIAVMALLASIYLALPPESQHQTLNGLRVAVESMGSLGLSNALAIGAVLGVGLSVALVFAPSYRKHGYLATSPSLIPQVSVYIDAENQLHENQVKRFTNFLRDHLNGRRADLLYFLDASEPRYREKYKTLYRFGFRPIDVPHDPTGTAPVKEAVDKELAMHAYERALLGPAKQEFIIVTGDQDFVALVYRLAALGHHVQVWATPIRAAYRELANYLDIDLIDLTHYVAELETPTSEPAEATTAIANRIYPVQATGAAASAHSHPSDHMRNTTGVGVSQVEPPLSPMEASGEQQIYRAIVQTLEAYDNCERTLRRPRDRNAAFRSRLGGELASRLAGVGYAAQSKIDYWISHLSAAGVLKWGAEPSEPFPERGPMPPDTGAHALFAVAQLAALSALHISQERPDTPISTSSIAAQMASQHVHVGVNIHDLLDLVAQDNPKRTTHARYFVRTARALGLLEFEDVPGSPEQIAHPRLPTVASDATSNLAVEGLGENPTRDQTPAEEMNSQGIAGPPASDPNTIELPLHQTTGVNEQGETAYVAPQKQ